MFLITFSSLFGSGSLCDQVQCMNGGTCNATNGMCDCPLGYRGRVCEVRTTTCLPAEVTGPLQRVNLTQAPGGMELLNCKL